MASKVKKKIGYMSCPGCQIAGRPPTRVLVREADSGTQSFQCDECDTIEYAKPGQQKFTDWKKRIQPLAPGEAEAPPAPAAPAPDKKDASAPAGAKLPWIK